MKNKKTETKMPLFADPIAHEYDTKKSLYERVVKFVKTEFDNYFEDVHADCIHYVKGRVKDLWSIYGKMVEKKTLSLMNIKDICGIRVVCFNEIDKEFIYKFIKDNPNFGSIHREIVKNREDGYSGWHIEMQAKVTYKGITTWHLVEIQLRTLAEDYFNTKSHREIYKKTINLPFDWKERMKELRIKIDNIEELSGDLRKEWERINASMEIPLQDYININSIQEVVKRELNTSISTVDAWVIFKFFLRFGINQISTLRNIVTDLDLEERFNSIKENFHVSKFRILDIIMIKMFLYLATDEKATAIMLSFMKKETKK